MSSEPQDEELEYLQFVTNRRISTKENNVEDSVGEQPDKRASTSKDMARSYGKYEKLRDTPDHLYGTLFLYVLLFGLETQCEALYH